MVKRKINEWLLMKMIKLVPIFQYSLLVSFPPLPVSPDWFSDARAGGGQFIILIPCKKYQYVESKRGNDSPSSLQRQEILTFKNSPWLTDDLRQTLLLLTKTSSFDSMFVDTNKTSHKTQSASFVQRQQRHRFSRWLILILAPWGYNLYNMSYNMIMVNLK